MNEDRRTRLTLYKSLEAKVGGLEGCLEGGKQPFRVTGFFQLKVQPN
jgi:hypothetical protein